MRVSPLPAASKPYQWLASSVINRDFLMQDQIIIGILEHNIREDLLMVQDLNLQKNIDICRVSEKAWHSQEMRTVEAHRMKVSTGKKGLRTHIRKWDKCPAYGNSCKACSGHYHFEAKCPNKEQSWSKKRKGNKNTSVLYALPQHHLR